MQIRHTPLSGGYCGEVPPLPIPNREVKLTCADGTAMQCGRVGSRLLSSRASDFERFLRLFCFPTAFSSALSFSHRFHRCTQFFLLLYLFTFFLQISQMPTDFYSLLMRRILCVSFLLFSSIICFLGILGSFMKKNERKTCSYNIFYYFCSQIHKTLNN